MSRSTSGTKSLLYHFVRGAFRRLVPQRVKWWIFWAPGNPWREFAQRVKSRWEAALPHDQVYDAEYYADVDETMLSAAPVIAETIIRRFSPNSVLDVGCGTGALLSEFTSRGVLGWGLEYSDAALTICRDRGLDVIKFDLENPQRLDLRADVTISTEVAEHLPEHVADRYLDLLVSTSDNVIFTAATPGQGGTDHVNEQPHGYWIQKFHSRGFALDATESESWRSAWSRAGVDSCYAANVMIFQARPPGVFPGMGSAST